MNVLRQGDAAPDFVLNDAEGKPVRLSSFSGNPIVLYFYPKDNTPGCIIEAKGFAGAHEELQRHGATVIGVSLDDEASHRSFRDRYELPFILLSDVDGHVHDLYEAWRTSLLGRNSFAVRRCTYLIDPDGVIARTYAVANVWGHTSKVIKDLERLAAQRAWGAREPPVSQP